jgi:hypothetical protein
MQYRLRTLLIVLAVGPVVLAGGYRWWPKSESPKAVEHKVLCGLFYPGDFGVAPRELTPEELAAIRALIDALPAEPKTDCPP